MQAAGDWGEGYITDVEYTHGFYPELAPLNLSLACILAGVRPPDFDAPFTYLELGCGNGLTTALLAATNPHGRFYANDFNPAHVLNARATAQAAGLSNATFLEASFAELHDAGLPELDVIALHGVWSWVSAENRHHIVETIRRRLKPGGLVYVSYNCLPGWAQVAPMRRLMIEATAGSGKAPAARAEDALAFAERLRDADGAFFAANPKAGPTLDHLKREDRNYLAHEYLNTEWSLFYHGEVAGALSAAKLGYAGQAALLDNFDQFTLTAAQRALAAECPGGAAETVKDFALDRRFRRDVYTRGAPRADGAAMSDWFGRRRFALVRPRAACTIQVKTRAGAFNLEARVFEPTLDALAAGPATPAELCGAGKLAGVERRHVQQALGVLCALGHVRPALSPAWEGEARVSAERFNAAVLLNAEAGRPVAALASPVLASGVTIPPIDQLFLASLRRGEDPAAQAAHPHASEGAHGDGGGEKLAERCRAFTRFGAPLLTRLGIRCGAGT